MEFIPYNKGVRCTLFLPPTAVKAESRPKWTLDQLFAYKTRFQVLTKTEEELDELKGWMLMYGRQLEATTWDQWRQIVRMSKIQNHYGQGKIRELLPMVFTTYDAENSLRGL